AASGTTRQSRNSAQSTSSATTPPLPADPPPAEPCTLSLHDALPIYSTVDIFTFYVPHRHVYAEQWIKFMKDGVNALFTINVTMRRSEERLSRNAETAPVCRLLLQKQTQQGMCEAREAVGHVQRQQPE